MFSDVLKRQGAKAVVGILISFLSEIFSMLYRDLGEGSAPRSRIRKDFIISAYTVPTFHLSLRAHLLNYLACISSSTFLHIVSIFA